jgi:hypothetical protein
MHRARVVGWRIVHGLRIQILSAMDCDWNAVYTVQSIV